MGAITTELVDTGEKRDARGRRVAPAELRGQMVQAYRKSGLTMAEFARREKLKYATLAGWVAKAQRGAGQGPINFAEVRLPLIQSGAPCSDQLEVRLPDGTILSGSRVPDLVALVRALRG